jgi:Flp pilus assembly protein TadD
MRKIVLGFSAAALALSLAACGGTDQPENNVAAEDLNALTNLEELPPADPTANAVVETPAAEEKAPAAKPAAEKPATAKPATAKPKPAEPKAAEPKAPDPSCLPEHRAAGHC